MNKPLLPCPFCGGLPAFGVIETEDDPNQGGHFISCDNPQCDATTGLVFACMDGPEQVLTEKWNLRWHLPADPLRPPEEMQKLAYRKGIEDAANKCEKRAEALPHDQCGVARLCKRDVMSLL